MYSRIFIRAVSPFPDPWLNAKRTFHGVREVTHFPGCSVAQFKASKIWELFTIVHFSGADDCPSTKLNAE
jgi:hypothetical protein